MSGAGTSAAATLAEHDSEGRLISLLGHFARANPQVVELQADPAATIPFSGPQGYVSPKLVKDSGWVPTWNYAVARFGCSVSFVPEGNDAALERLTAKMRESNSEWSLDRMGERYHRMKAHIIAFRAKILDRRATFTLGQGGRPANFASRNPHISFDLCEFAP